MFGHKVLTVIFGCEIPSVWIFSIGIFRNAAIVIAAAEDVGALRQKRIFLSAANLIGGRVEPRACRDRADASINSPLHADACALFSIVTAINRGNTRTANARTPCDTTP